MSLHSKLADVMGEVGRIPKNGRNTFHNYDYVLESDLVEAVRQKLASRQIMLYPSVEEVERTGTVTTVRVKFTAADGESGETFEFWGAGSGDDKSDKGIYKALTGAEKYALMKLFLIATGDDPEADRAADKSSAESVGRAEPSRRESVAPSGGNSPSAQPPAGDKDLGGSSVTPSSGAGVSAGVGEGEASASAAPPASGKCGHSWIAAPRQGFQVCEKCGQARKGTK